MRVSKAIWRRQWKRPRGQALVLIVFMFIGLLLFLGIMLDLGQIFLAKAYLRKTADAAALTAAGQFRKGNNLANMVNAAEEVAHLNNIDPTSIVVETCTTTPSDPDLCVLSGGVPRKLVRVTITLTYPLTFLSLLNINNVVLTEASTSEAASLDLVLVLDESESMTWDSGVGDPKRDPSACNGLTVADTQCLPFYYVKYNAQKFAEQILDLPPSEEQDRISIITFANGWENGQAGTYRMDGSGFTNGWTRSKDSALDAIDSMWVYDPPPCDFAFYNVAGAIGSFSPNDPAPCRLYSSPGSTDPADFLQLACPRADGVDTEVSGDYTAAEPQAWSACGTTNIGGGLLQAGNQFTVDKRPEALWVVVILTDGAANATYATMDMVGGSGADYATGSIDNSVVIDRLNDGLPFGFCPDGTWDGSSAADMLIPGMQHHVTCQDGNSKAYHNSSSAAYDASDFARDMANFVACPATNPPSGCSTGQGAYIYTIGLGQQILANDMVTGTPYGGNLLRYMAAVGDDHDPSTDLCGGVTDYSESCGNYFYAAVGADLGAVFDKIASKIFTRLTK